MNTYDNQLVLAGIVCFLLLVTVYGEGKSANHEKKTLVFSHDDLDGQASTARLPNNPIHYYACCSLIK